MKVVCCYVGVLVGLSTLQDSHALDFEPVDTI